MDNFLKLLTVLMAEIKDPGTLLKRAGTLLVTVIIYFVINNTAELGSYLKVFSTSAVLEDIQEQRVKNFPNVAREKVMILYAQTKADVVFVTKYKPDAINDYQNIVAWEGNVQIEKTDLEDKAVDKTSELYRRHLDGFNYSYDFTTKTGLSRYSGVDIPDFKNASFEFIYTCPYFNLNNIYSGYIAIGWKKKPIDDADLQKFNDYLFRLCSPQRGSLGRSI